MQTHLQERTWSYRICEAADDKSDRLVHRFLKVMNCSADCTAHIAQLARPEQHEDDH